MRHGKKVNHLGRKTAHRKALMRNLAISLIEHKRINTTLAKAKSLRQFIEPLVTKSKTNTSHSRRVVFSYLQNKEATSELFGEIARRVGERPGGYVRILKTGFRQGDAAEIAMIELVDFNEIYSGKSTGAEGKKKSRRRRGGKSKAAAAATATAGTAVASEAVAETIEDTTAVAENVEETVQETVVEKVQEVKEEIVQETNDTVADATKEEE